MRLELEQHAAKMRERNRTLILARAEHFAARGNAAKARMLRESVSAPKVVRQSQSRPPKVYGTEVEILKGIDQPWARRREIYLRERR